MRSSTLSCGARDEASRIEGRPSPSFSGGRAAPPSTHIFQKRDQRGRGHARNSCGSTESSGLGFLQLRPDLCGEAAHCPVIEIAWQLESLVFAERVDVRFL